MRNKTLRPGIRIMVCASRMASAIKGPIIPAADKTTQTRRLAIVCKCFAKYYGPKWDFKRQNGRREPWVTIRQAAMFLVRELIGASYPDIALYFGLRDHNTVICACHAVRFKIRELKWLAEDVKMLRGVIEAVLRADEKSTRTNRETRAQKSPP